MIDFHGRSVPAPPKGAPPPVPSPAMSRRPSAASSKYSSKHVCNFLDQNYCNTATFLHDVI